jgi:hypothetical protein
VGKALEAMGRCIEGAELYVDGASLSTNNYDLVMSHLNAAFAYKKASQYELAEKYNVEGIRAKIKSFKSFDSIGPGETFHNISVAYVAGIEE